MNNALREKIHQALPNDYLGFRCHFPGPNHAFLPLLEEGQFYLQWYDDGVSIGTLTTAGTALKIITEMYIPHKKSVPFPLAYWEEMLQKTVRVNGDFIGTCFAAMEQIQQLVPASELYDWIDWRDFTPHGVRMDFEVAYDTAIPISTPSFKVNLEHGDEDGEMIYLEMSPANSQHEIYLAFLESIDARLGTTLASEAKV